MYSTYECTCRIKLDTHFVSDFESRNKRNRWDEKEDIEFVVSSGSMLCKTSRNLRLTPNWNHAPLGFQLLPAHFRPPDHHKFIGGGQPPSQQQQQGHPLAYDPTCNYKYQQKRGMKNTLQGSIYNFLERPTGWKCFVYHFTV